MQPEDRGRALTVLIVEDEVDLREAVAEAIGDAGYHFISVGDLDRARAALATTRIDLILLDMLVAGVSCDDWLAELSLHINSPATVLTSADATPRSQALATHYSLPLLLKPFDLDDLMALLGRAHAEGLSPSRPA